MKQFVLIFRQNSNQLSDADLKLRAQQVGAWAVEQNKAGHKLDPRILDQENLRIGSDRKPSPASNSSDGPVTALLFVEAEDFSGAVKVAESHPALDFGAITVEVRPWAAPGPPK